MKQVRTYSELFKELEKHIPNIIKNFGEEIRKALKSELKAKFYGRPGYEQDSDGTDYYTRTWELLDSIVCSPVEHKGGKYTVRIYYDTDRMNTYPPVDDSWSKHQSITTGTDIRLMLPYWVEFGQNSPLYSWGGFNIVGDLADRLIEDHELLNCFVAAFRKLGFIVEA